MAPFNRFNHSRHFLKLLINPTRSSSTTHFISPSSLRPLTFSSPCHRPISYLSLSDSSDEDAGERNCTTIANKKPLHILFQEAVGLAEKPETSESESENSFDLQKNLMKLEREVRILKQKEKEKKLDTVLSDAMDDGGSEKHKVLSSLFRDEKKLKKEYKRKDVKVKKEEPVSRGEAPMIFKKLSEDMEMFVTHLYNEGYFRDANFLPVKGFDLSVFDDSYGRDFIKYAAEKFGKDHQEIAKWLSGKDLKSLALFGCPTLTKKNVFAAKRMRTFFEIHENTVCSKCMLKESCKFPNQIVWKGDSKNLMLDDVMRVITLFALEAVDPQLVVPEDLKLSVSRLLREVVNLSRTVEPGL